MTITNILGSPHASQPAMIKTLTLEELEPVVGKVCALVRASTHSRFYFRSRVKCKRDLTALPWPAAKYSISPSSALCHPLPKNSHSIFSLKSAGSVVRRDMSLQIKGNWRLWNGFVREHTVFLARDLGPPC